MPKPVVKSITHGAQKWKDRASSATGVYTDGINSTSKSWEANAAAAEPAWKAGVSNAATQGRFGKGVTKAGNAHWKANAIAKGPDRYAQGVGIGQPRYQAGAAPYYDAIGSVDLPARGAKGSESNYQRVAPIGKALHQLKLGR